MQKSIPDTTIHSQLFIWLFPWACYFLCSLEKNYLWKYFSFLAGALVFMTEHRKNCAESLAQGQWEKRKQPHNSAFCFLCGPTCFIYCPFLVSAATSAASHLLFYCPCLPGAVACACHICFSLRSLYSFKFSLYIARFSVVVSLLQLWPCFRIFHSSSGPNADHFLSAKQLK